LTNNGNNYINVKLDVVDSDGVIIPVYDPMFHKNRILELLMSFGKEDLILEVEDVSFKLEELKGYGGKAIFGPILAAMVMLINLR